MPVTPLIPSLLYNLKSIHLICAIEHVCVTSTQSHTNKVNFFNYLGNVFRRKINDIKPFISRNIRSFPL